MANQSGAALDGVRILELGSTIAGPSAGRRLADLGAEVIKVEQPEGDQLRTWGELAHGRHLMRGSNRTTEISACSCSICANPRTFETVRAIALACDVVIENFRPGWLEERGLGPVALRALKPDLIYVSISGYGQTGPYATRPGFGNIAEAMGGLRFITGEPDGADAHGHQHRR